jgi:GAF domain-containing protein
MDPKQYLAGSAPGLDEGAVGVRSWLAAPLTRLDGRQIGVIHVFDRRPDAYTAEDEGVLLHLAQMGSAAVERVDLYARASAGAASRREESAR